MGRVTGALVVGPGGRSEPLPAWPARAVPRGQVELLYDYRPELLPDGRERLAAPPGMWRYMALLPLDEGPVRYPLPVGGTPLLAPEGLRRQTGLPGLWIKDETRGPSGSNKDRATALVLEQALRTGAGTVSCASTGNVAVSLALGAAAAGVRAVVFVPSDVGAGKLAPMLLAGAVVVRVREGYEAAFRLSREAAAAFGWLDRNTGVNPVTLEAKKTVAFEIWEQLGRRMPDAVVAPVGDGPTLAAVAKGFAELERCGASGPGPRLIGVQAEGCRPLARAFEEGGPIAWAEPATIADGIAVAAPVAGESVLRDVRRTGGAFVTVSDARLLEAIALLARAGGLLAEPAGAAAYAALDQALARGLVTAGETVVALLTGTGLKTPGFLRTARAPLDVSADLGAVERALDGWGADAPEGGGPG